MSQLTCFRKFGLAIAALLFLGFSTTAKADTINIIGNTTGSLATATVTCSFNAQTNTFTFTIFNTSPFNATITAIGFDLPPGGNASDEGLNGFTGSVTFQPVGTDFHFGDGNLGNVPQFNDAVLDFGFSVDDNGNFTGGNPNEGLPPGIDPGDEATFVVSGAAFAGFTEDQICNAIFVRFQVVGPNGNLSDVGTPGNGTPVPEPTSMLLLGMGLSGVAAAVRRRNRKKT